MLASLANAFRLPDLRRRILFTLGVLAIYRLAAHVPVPGLDLAALRAVLNSGDATAGVLRFINMMSGGALDNMSVVAMGVYPYITASIIMQLLTPLIPALEELAKEGEHGRNRINLYTYWMAVPLAIVQGIAQIFLINQTSTGTTQVLEFGSANPLNTVTVLLSLTAGTMFALWLGERITENGIGNGVSIIIFGGIVSGIPSNVLPLLGDPIALLLILGLTLLTVLTIVVIQEGHRRIPVQYGKRVRGTRVYGGQSTHIPLRVNSAGMIPLIFASSILLFPSLIAQALNAASSDTLRNIGSTVAVVFAPASIYYWLLYFLLVVVFTFFYTDVVFRQQNLHETLQRQGGFIPGIRPGQRTESYLNGIMHRITLVGALFLGTVAILPYFAGVITGSGAANSQSMIITSTGLLIVVGVVLDTIKQLEAQLLMRHYEGFIK